MIKRVSYFKGADNEILYKIMFSLKPSTMEEGSIVLSTGQNADSLIFIEDGILEVVTELEDQEFVIEKLFRGSAIN